MAGTVIAASLVTGLNSDLPGFVIAQVTEHVYDTVSGRFLLVPQGSRLIGKYDNIVAFGQERALVVWQRIILPDGSSIVIDNLPATDSGGYAGLADEVDLHTWKLLKGVALATVLGVGSELAFGSSDSDLIKALQQSTPVHDQPRRTAPGGAQPQRPADHHRPPRLAAARHRPQGLGDAPVPQRHLPEIAGSNQERLQCPSSGPSQPSRTATPAASARSP
jgi:type IV secretory pathway VirB10-like protein